MLTETQTRADVTRLDHPGVSATSFVHLSIQGKGGIGKSLVATILAQHLRRSYSVRCFDTDPLNSTFARFETLGVKHLQITKDNVIDDRLFDVLLESICTEEGPFVIDTGATAFIPFWHYVVENKFFDALASYGRTVKLHCVVAGGQALLDTLTGLEKIAALAPPESVIPWVNEYFGPVETLDGKTFEKSKLLVDHADKIHGIVRFRERSRTTFGVDIREMLEQRLTFDEAIEVFPLMAKMRLRMVRDDVFAQLEAIGL